MPMQQGGVIQQPRTTREYMLKEWAALENAILPHMAMYRDISDYIVPFASSFRPEDKDRDSRSKQTLIIDSSGTYASDVLRSGLLAGKTSPAKPWFVLETPDRDLNKFKPVKQWLHTVAFMMHKIFQSSNTYRALHTLYSQLGNFGVAPTMILDDFDDVIRHYTLPVGEYRIGTDQRGQVNLLYREYTLTVEQAVQRFGKNVTATTMDHYNRGNYHQSVRILHCVKPRRNHERDLSSKLAKDMPFMSVHIEFTNTDPQKEFLKVSGFRDFPIPCPRWDVTRTTDAYGNGPGHRALGDIIQLQQEQLRKAQAIDYQANPPLAIPTALKNRELDTLPGGTSYIDTAAGDNKISTLFNVNLQLDHLLADIVDVRERIDKAYFKDLFLMLANDRRSDITATEILRREEEKVMMLGPVVNRMDNELLDKMIDITFSKMVTANILPPPPVELENMELMIDYVSVLAQAQKATGILNLDRYMTSIGSVAAVKPNILDKVDEDSYADVMADMLGVDPSIVLSGKEVARIRTAKAEATEQQNAMQAANMGADTAAKLSQANMNDDNALTRIAQGLGA